MGKSTPKAPAAPDPVATANAQASMNKETAVAQANLDRINQYTPYGNLTYQVVGTNSDGTPKYQSTQTLSPEQQKLYQTQTAVEQNMNQLALTNMNRVNQAQSKPFNYDGMTPMATSVGNAGSIMGINPSALSLQGNVTPGQVQSSYGNGGNIQTSAGQQQPLASNVQQGQMQMSPADTFAIQNGYKTADYGTGYNAGGQVQSSIAPAGSIAGGYNTSQYATQIGGAPDVQQQLSFSGASALPGANDFSAQGQKVGDAVYQQAQSRLDPQFAQLQNDMRTRLASMGISEGSEAYNREMDNFTRQRTDAYNDANFRAIQASGTEQSRQFADALSARQEGVNETSLAGNFANSAQGQIFGQQQARGQFTNSATQAQNADNASLAQFGNSAQQQLFGQNQAQGQFANAAQQQQNTQNQSAAQFSNDAIGRQNADNATKGAFYNSAQQQQFAQNQSRMDAVNSAQAQMFNQGQQNAQLQNSAAGQFFNQNLQAGTFANAAQQQAYSQNQQNAAFANDAQQQKFNQGQQNAALNNSTQQQQRDALLASTGFNNTAQNQQFNQNAANAQLQNASRQQQIQEATYLRNLPLNEIAALLGTGSGVQNPTFTSVPQVGVAAPDYQGAVQANYNAQMNAYNQQMAGQSSMLGSIFGGAASLGSAAIMASDRRLKDDVRRVGELHNGIGLYTYRYAGNDNIELGVMAQDVFGIMPDAVVDMGGFHAVDYAKVAA